jgi:tyrosyl-tRNA synthetase
MAIQNIATELKARGLLQDEGGGKSEEFLGAKRTVYLGIDPTAESLQVGNLVPIMLMKHLMNAGHDVVFLVGGGTGMIGDPRASGERVLLDLKTIAKNKKAVHGQLSVILGKRTKIYDNMDWLGKLGLIEFLRDTAKHFTVNQLIKREIIKKRLETEDDSISFTEFTYSLLQGYDFWHLFKKYGVDTQVGGSDQWANIISGVDLIRRRESGSAYALTTPIIEDKKTGRKFGKSEGNAVWLDPRKTSPYAFYQFWLNASDEGVIEYLKVFTMLSLHDIDALSTTHAMNPGARLAQKKLAYEVTAMIHGAKAAAAAERVSTILFGGGALAALGKDDLIMLKREAPNTPVAPGTSVIDALVAVSLAASKGEARRLIEQGGVSLNDGAITDPARAVAKEDFIQDLAIIRRGKKAAILVAGR